MISQRTRDALARAKTNGKRLGNRTNLAEAQASGRQVQVDQAQQRAANLLPVIHEIRSAGCSTLREIAAVLTQPEVAKSFESQGMVPASSTPAEFGALMKKDADRWAAVVKRGNITAD